MKARWLPLFLSPIAMLAVDARASISSSQLDDAHDAITAIDLDRAEKLLSGLDPNDPKVGYEHGRLALYRGDCDAAVRAFSPEKVQKVGDAGALLTISKGCARAMAATVTLEDKDHQVVVRFQDDADTSILSVLGETIAKQRDVLEKDLGVKMPLPTHVDVVRDQFSLAAMTGLPHESAQTTGTVAIAKFGRVILLSPRAPATGYAWRDTVAHELTHLALSRGTLDRAPLWLQEGVAKREEVRWRPAIAADEAASPDAICAAGMAQGLGRPLDDLGPSIAMLPSAKEAMVVFAEVTSFVHFIAGDRAGVPGASTDAGALKKLVADYARGLDTDPALADATGKDLAHWNEVWRPWVATQGKKLPPSIGLEVGKPSAEAIVAERDAGKNIRLAELLMGRDHGKEARTLLDPLAAPFGTDPMVGARIAEARLMDGDVAGAKSILDPATVLGVFGDWWIARGDALVASGAPAAESAAAYEQAIAHVPFAIGAACGWSTVALSPWDTVAKALCVTARARAWPRLGQD